MKQTDIVYTISSSYYIEIRVRKCFNMFRLRLMNKDNERIAEICCPQDEYNKSMDKLINLAKQGE